MIAAVSLCVGAFGLAAQQQASITAIGIASRPLSTLRLDDTREAIDGTWTGGIVILRLVPLAVEGSATTGRLRATDNTVAFQRDGGELRGIGRLEVSPYFGLEGGDAIRAFDSPAGYQRWEMPLVGGRISAPLGHPALSTFLRGHFMPAVKVSGQDTPELAVSGEAGLLARLGKLPFMLHVSYRIERFDFPQGIPKRVEQFETLQGGLGLHLGN